MTRKILSYEVTKLICDKILSKETLIGNKKLNDGLDPSGKTCQLTNNNKSSNEKSQAIQKLPTIPVKKITKHFK